MSWQSWLLNLLLRLRRGVMRYRSELQTLRSGNAKIDDRFGRGLDRTAGLSAAQNGDIVVDRYLPPALSDTAVADRKVLLLFHGGAYCLRSPNIYRRMLIHLCNELHAEGVLPDYRLAPEYPHPTGINDCFNCYSELLRAGYSPNNIVIFGDSAGGGLSLSVLQRVIAEGLPVPAGAALSSPAGDWTLSTPSLFENEGRDPMFRLASFLFFRSLYLNGHDPSDPAVSPMLGSYDSLPPLYILASSSELLRDTAVEIHRRAGVAGVTSHLHLARNLCHDYPMFGFLPEARAARRDIIAFYKHSLAKQPGSLANPAHDNIRS